MYASEAEPFDPAQIGSHTNVAVVPEQRRPHTKQNDLGNTLRARPAEVVHGVTLGFADARPATGLAKDGAASRMDCAPTVQLEARPAASKSAEEIHEDVGVRKGACR
ncbi:MAG: hypothetical protein WBP81_07115 [Solirubrobacteraceae bacterium]